MRNLFLLFLLVLIHCSVIAQQKPQFTQYIFNNYLTNPAISGIENYIDVKTGHRTQWTGLDGAPITNYFSIHAPLGKEFLFDNANSFDGQENNPMNRSYTQYYMAAAPHHGIGLQGVIDKAGPISRLDLNATYAYHLGISSKVNISLGVAAGISKVTLNMDKVSLGDDLDPAVVAGENERLIPELSAGIWVYSARYFIGLSAQQLLGQTFSFTNDKQYKETRAVPHFYFTTGYKVFLGEDFAMIPSVMIKKVSSTPMSYDTNLKLAFRNNLWVGGSYRHGDALAALVGFNLSHLFNLSYSYDFTTSNLGDVSNGTHEIVLGFLLNNRYKLSGSQRNW